MEDKMFVTVKEAASRLNLTVQWTYRLLRKGMLSGKVDATRHYMVEESSLKNYVPSSAGRKAKFQIEEVA